MFRIDNSTAAAALPAPAAAGTPGYFAHGNPSGGVPATVLDPDWCNSIQEELIAVVAAGKLTPSKTSDTQVRDAILAMIAAYATTSLAANGYIEMFGLVIQWGTVPLGSGSNYVATPMTFPIPFPMALWGIYGNADGGANANWHPVVVTFDAASLTGCTVSADSANANQTISVGRAVRWFAIGN